jgi:hypothetical protein
MTRHAMTSADRTKIIEALKTNPNAAAVARQFGFSETTILAICKKEGVGLKTRHGRESNRNALQVGEQFRRSRVTAKQSRCGQRVTRVTGMLPPLRPKLFVELHMGGIGGCSGRKLDRG